MNNSKYIETELIYTLDELMKQEFISHRGKVYNRGWFNSWQLSYANRQIVSLLCYKVKLREMLK